MEKMWERNERMNICLEDFNFHASGPKKLILGLIGLGIPLVIPKKKKKERVMMTCNTLMKFLIRLNI